MGQTKARILNKATKDSDPISWTNEPSPENAVFRQNPQMESRKGPEITGKRDDGSGVD